MSRSNVLRNCCPPNLKNNWEDVRAPRILLGWPFYCWIKTRRAESRFRALTVYSQPSKSSVIMWSLIYVSDDRFLFHVFLFRFYLAFGTHFRNFKLSIFKDVYISFSIDWTGRSLERKKKMFIASLMSLIERTFKESRNYEWLYTIKFTGCSYAGRSLFFFFFCYRKHR